MGSPGDDARGKSFVVSPHKAGIYVYRNEALGFAAPMTVRLDGRLAGRTRAHTYLFWEVEPGEHSITSHAEDVASVTLTAEPGKAYFVWQEVKLGLWSARSLLHEVDPAQGRSGVAQCQIGASML